ncbi:MAG: hypothetical protein ACR2OZ_09435 [Verrucomicrobiales bacterium]
MTRNSLSAYVTGGPLPKTYQWWKESFFNRLNVTQRPEGGGGFDIHHDVENRILARFGIKDVSVGDQE